MASSLPLNWNDELPDLPMEVWHEIWSYVDFDTLQKKSISLFAFRISILDFQLHEFALQGWKIYWIQDYYVKV